MCDVTLYGRSVGTIKIRQDGLYYRLSCRCKFQEPGFYRVQLSGDPALDLGLCVPIDEWFGFDMSVPVKRMGKPPFVFEVIGDHKGLFITADPEEQFEQLEDLLQGRMSRQDGVDGIVIPVDPHAAQAQPDSDPIP